MRILVIAACLLACTGCIPVSLHSIATEPHFDDRYLGVWGAEEGAWELVGGQVIGSHPDPAGGNEYVMEYGDYDVYYTEGGKSSELVGTLTKIDGVDFLDLTPRHGMNSRWGNQEIGGEWIATMLTLPLHTWVKIEVVDGKLRMLPVDMEYINGVLEQDPGALPHLNRGSDDWPLITASPEQLRAFIATRMRNEGFFGEMADLTRLGNPQTRRSRTQVQTGGANYDQQYRQQPESTQQNYEQK